MPSIPPLVDQFGNISVHPREELLVPIAGGIDGSGSNIGTKLYFFEILDLTGRVLLRIALPADPSDITRKLLRLDRSQLALIPAAGAAFVVLDETSGTPRPVWEGRIKRRPL